MLNHLYADDFSGGTNDRVKALKLFENSKEIMEQGGFNLRKWNSNDKDVLRKKYYLEIKRGSLNPSKKQPIYY